MGVSLQTPRHWHPIEVELVRSVAARCWDSMERAQVERALRESEERLRLGLEAGNIGTWDWDIVRNRRVHMAYLIWFAIFLPTSLIVQWLWDTPAWHATARRLMGV